jgi:hypothetical protein
MRANDPLVLLLGLLGLIPFVVCAYLACAWRDPSEGRALIALIAYGAVILSFLGGVHEGFAILAPGPLPGAKYPAGDWQAAAHRRILGASACALAAWLALAAALTLSPAAALALLIAGFIALPVLEQRAAAHGWMPRGYLWLRWVLSVIVTLTLAAVLVMRLLGSAG